MRQLLPQTSVPLSLAWTSGMATAAAASGQGEQKTKDSPWPPSKVLQWTHEVCGAVRKPPEVQRGHQNLSQPVVALMKEVPFLLKPASTHPLAASPRYKHLFPCSPVDSVVSSGCTSGGVGEALAGSKNVHVSL